MSRADAARPPLLVQPFDRDWWRRRPQAVPASTVDVAGDPPGLSFWAIVAFTVILLLAPQQTVMPFLSPLHIAMLSVLVAVAAHGRDWLRRGTPLVQPTPAVVLSGLLLAWAVVTIPWSMWPGGSVAIILGLFLKALIIFWLLGTVMTGTDRLRRLAWVLTLVTVPLAMTALHHFATGDFMQDVGPAVRIVGYEAPLTDNPNDLALLINIIAPLTLALMFIDTRRWIRLLLGAALVLDVTAIIATFSRAGFLSLIVSSMLFLWRFRSRLNPAWIVAAAMVGVLALPLLPASYLHRVGTILHNKADRTGSAQARRSDMIVAARYTAAHPIVGAGIGMDMLAMNAARGPKWVKVHDVYLEYSLELGLPGLLLFVLLMAWCLRAVGRIRKARPQSGVPPDLRWLAEGLAISLTTFAVSAVFYPIAYEFYFYYLAGLAVAMEATTRQGSRRDSARLPVEHPVRGNAA